MSSRGAALAPQARTRAGARDLPWWIALCGLCVTLLAPLFVVDVPPLLDYPNHLARAFILDSLPQDAVLAQFYAPHWSIIPNLALDLILPPLIHVLPVHIAGRLVIAVAVLLPVCGSVAYNSALGGRWWSLGVGLIAYNDCLLLGFLNFSIALGLALLLAAGWLRWREEHPGPAIILAIAGALALFACHLMGLVFFGALIGGAELLRLHQLWRLDIARPDIPRPDIPRPGIACPGIARPDVARLGIARSGAAQCGVARPDTGCSGIARAGIVRGSVLLLIFAGPAALYALSALQQLGGDAEFLPFGEKLQQLVTTFVNYNWPLDVATAAVAFALPALCVLLRWGRVPGPAAYAMTLLLITFLLAPYAWKGTYLLDTRLAVMLGFMLFAGFVPTCIPRMLGFVATVVLALIFLVRMALLISVWTDRRSDLVDLRRVLQSVHPGQAVYLAEAGIEERPDYWRANPRRRALSDGTRTDEHLGALVLIEHRAYWPFAFDNPSQQPIETREPYRTLAGRVGHIPTWSETAVADVCGFNDVLLMEADALPDLPPERFRLLARSGFAALYAVTACHPPG
ncbi:MAG TPA: hypothetical protein VGC09_09760 [Rhodopila sp.]